MTKDKLLNALKLCHPALGDNSVVPGLDCYYFIDKQVVAYNGVLRIAVNLDEELPFSGWIQGDPLFKVLNSLDKDITLSIENDNTLIVKSGRSKASFPIQQSEKKIFEEPDIANLITELPNTLLFNTALTRCMISVPMKDNTQEAGMYLFKSGSEYKLYASNKLTVSSYEFNFDNEWDDVELFLPALFCEQYNNTHAAIKEETTAILVGSEYIQVDFPSCRMHCAFYSNAVKGDLKNAVDTAVADVEIVATPSDLSGALKRAEVVSPFITLYFGYTDDEDKPILELTADGRGKQHFNETIEMAYATEGKVTVDVKSLRKLVDNCNEVGFCKDFMMLNGNDNCFTHIIAAYNEGA